MTGENQKTSAIELVEDDLDKVVGGASGQMSKGSRILENGAGKILENGAGKKSGGSLYEEVVVKP